MWVIRILNGKQSGQALPLRDGKHIVGRSSQSDIQLDSPEVSKQHAELIVSQGMVSVRDLGSSNGTFVNGIQVRQQKLKAEDKVSFHDIILELVEAPTSLIVHPRHSRSVHTHTQQVAQAYGNVAYDSTFDPLAQQQTYNESDPHTAFNQASVPLGQLNDAPQEGHSQKQMATGIQGILAAAQNYMDKVVLPGVYKLTEWMELKWVMLLFTGVFVILVTILSTLPLVRILKSSIERESQRRALTIARTLAKVNRSSIMQGIDSAVTIDIAAREPGVREALVVKDMDGSVIAPARQAGRFREDLPFIHNARKLAQEAVHQIDDNTVGAIAPIEFYNPNTGSQTTAAHAIVIYDMGSLAVDDQRTISLYVQTLALALIIGGIIFYFLFKLIEYPIVSINRQLDVALRQQKSDITLNFLFPPLQSLISNMNATLTRVTDVPADGGHQALDYDRSQEMANLVQLIGFSALAIHAHDRTIAAVNPAFEERTGINAGDVLYQSVDNINDQALRLSIQDLLDRVAHQPDQLATNELDFSGQSFEIAAQAIFGLDKIAYLLIVLLPPVEEAAE